MVGIEADPLLRDPELDPYKQYGRDLLVQSIVHITKDHVIGRAYE